MVSVLGALARSIYTENPVFLLAISVLLAVFSDLIGRRIGRQEALRTTEIPCIKNIENQERRQGKKKVPLGQLHSI